MGRPPVKSSNFVTTVNEPPAVPKSQGSSMPMGDKAEGEIVGIQPYATNYSQFYGWIA